MKNFGIIKKLGSSVVLGSLIFSIHCVSAGQETSTLSVSSTGRALLKTQDLKTLLQASIAESSQSSDNGITVGSTGSFLMGLNKFDLSSLIAKVDDIQSQRAALESELRLELSQKVQEVRARRRAIQNKRLSSMSQEDSRLAKALYENVLEESNLDSKVKKGLEDFDNSHLVSLDFIQFKGSRIVQSISLGSQKLWASQESMNIAKSK